MTMIRGGSRGTAPGGWWLPIVLVVCAFFVLMAFETANSIYERGSLAEQHRLQEPVVQEAIKLRQKLETLAAKTAQLAADGDEGAKAVVEQMKRQGITLSSAKP